jgi:HSP90 family molecular chaperone
MFEIAPAENVPVGTRIVIELKEDAKQFSQDLPVELIIQKYSNFVGFPITLNGQAVNTIQPLWTMAR